MEANSQLTKSDEIQRMVVQAQTDFNRRDFLTAAAQLDTIIEVSRSELPTFPAVQIRHVS